jgi:hypothetical protein
VADRLQQLAKFRDAEALLALIAEHRMGVRALLSDEQGEIEASLAHWVVGSDIGSECVALSPRESAYHLLSRHAPAS